MVQTRGTHQRGFPIGGLGAGLGLAWLGLVPFKPDQAPYGYGTRTNAHNVSAVVPRLTRTVRDQQKPPKAMALTKRRQNFEAQLDP